MTTIIAALPLLGLLAVSVGLAWVGNDFLRAGDRYLQQTMNIALNCELRLGLWYGENQ